jgi:hypothetical protein
MKNGMAIIVVAILVIGTGSISRGQAGGAAGEEPVKGSQLSQKTALLAKISYENVKHLRQTAQQKTPDWARAVFEEKVRVLKERAERSYKQTGRWYYVKHDNGDCGDTVWWDEVSSDRVYVQLQGLLGGIENLPNYSPENHRKAIEFYQSWQDEKTGLFHNPHFVDPGIPVASAVRMGTTRVSIAGSTRSTSPVFWPHWAQHLSLRWRKIANWQRRMSRPPCGTSRSRSCMGPRITLGKPGNPPDLGHRRSYRQGQDGAHFGL